MALNLPSVITAGDTLVFIDSVAGYSAADGWVLTYAFANGAEQYSIESTADGSDYGFNVLASKTREWMAGSYRYQAYVSKDSQRFTVGRGFLDVRADLEGSAGDPRSHVEKTLSAIELMLEGKASRDEESISINGRSLSRMKIEDLLVWRDKYRAELKQIQAADRMSQGLSSGNKIMVRF